MTTSLKDVNSLENISASQYPEADHGSLVHFIELKKIESLIEIRQQSFEYAQCQWEIRVKEFERRKYFFLMFYCAIASCIGVLSAAITFWVITL